MDVLTVSALLAAAIGALSTCILYLRLQTATNARIDAEKHSALATQRLEDLRDTIADRETHRQDIINATKAAALETSHQISNKLLEDHKRELETAKKQTEETTKKTTEQLTEHFKTITASVVTLHDHHTKSSARVDTLWKALSTPAGAGQLAEIGLENSLKSLSLESGRDFVMQYSITGDEGRSLRPDCIVFLPQDKVMVIDSKASKFLLELAEADLADKRAEVLERLKRTMNDHLKALISRDYKTAVQSTCKTAGRSAAPTHVFSVMYVPSEAALLHIREVDAEFQHKAERAGLILAGPASLYGLLSLARAQLDAERQAESTALIIQTSQELLDTLTTAFSYIDKVGKGIKTSMEQFDAFARSANKFVLPKMRKLTQLGVKPVKAKELPARIGTYEIRAAEDLIVIEAEEPAPTVPTLMKAG